jgi:drug/metabolite transporter (DMT)-like permease
MVGTTEGSPLITILFSFLLKMEKINIYQVGGLILVYAGGLITMTKGNFNVFFHLDIVRGIFSSYSILFVLAHITY